MLPRIAFSTAVLFLFAIAETCSAQSYKKGDEIEVLHLGDWTPAVVVQTNARGEVLAEYEFANRSRQDVFKAADVRFAFESGALARARMWSDASGKFKIKAALIDLTDDAITLRKPDKGEITISVSKLSEGDRSFLKKLMKQNGPIAPKPPEAEEFQDSSTFGQAAWGAAERVAVPPDPEPASLNMKQGGALLPQTDFFDRLGAVLPLGGSDAWVLAAMENATPGAPKPTRLLWTSLAKTKVVGEQALPAGEIVMDYHTKSRQLLTCSSVERSGSELLWGDVHLTLWSVLPTDTQAKGIVRWRVRSENHAPSEPWARIIDENTVLQRRQKQEYVIWDIQGKSMRSRITQESFFAAPAALSGGKKYLVLPEDKRVRILEAATGNLVSTYPADDGASGVAVSTDGTRLAVLNRSKLKVWDLTSADAPPETYQAEAIGSPFGASLAWLGKDRIMVNTNWRRLVLFSLPSRIALWNYEFDWNAVSEGSGRRLRDVVDGHLIYAATVDGAGPQKGIAVGAVQLPGPSVNEVDAATTRESLLVMKPGSPVRLEVSAGEYQSRVEAALRKEVEKNGWVVTSDAPNVLVAEMKQGETQSTTYRQFGTGETTTVSITPYISSLRLKVGEHVAWQSGTSGGAPPIVSLQKGETIQGEVDKWNKPSPQFFEGVDVPDSVLDPEKRLGLGTTQVTNRGLIPKPTATAVSRPRPLPSP